MQEKLQKQDFKVAQQNYEGDGLVEVHSQTETIVNIVDRSLEWTTNNVRQQDESVGAP